MKKITTLQLVIGALCIALSFVLSKIELFAMPQGGSVTPASMLPLIAFALAYGPGPSLLVSLAFGLIKMLFDGYVVTPVQGLLDYVISYAGIALCGLFAKRKLSGAVVGITTTGLWRYACSVLSGVIFFAAYAPEGQNVWVYSLLYNLTIPVEAAICLVIMIIPQVRKTLDRVMVAS